MMRQSRHLLVIPAALLLWAAPSQAAPLVYEGFDYAVADGATMAGVATSATGLTGNYAANLSGFATTKYDATGLSFGSLPVTGGSLVINVPAERYAILGARLNAGTVTGTVYESYLFTASDLAITTAGNGTFTRLSDLHSQTQNERLGVMPETKLAGSAPGISYTGSNGGEAVSGSLAEDTTYLFLARFTNVGITKSAGNPGTANIWVFNLADYNAWQTAGGQEADLDTYATLTAEQQVESGTHNFNNNSYLQFAGTVSSSSTETMNAHYDELRFGTTLGDVVIPEPATLALIGIGAMMMIPRRRR